MIKNIYPCPAVFWLTFDCPKNFKNWKKLLNVKVYIYELMRFSKDEFENEKYWAMTPFETPFLRNNWN